MGLTPLKSILEECCNFVVLTNLYIGRVIFVVYKLATLTTLLDSDFMVVCRNGLNFTMWTLFTVAAFENLSWYSMLGCNNVDMHSCPLCSHSQATAVIMTLRQGQQEGLFEHYQYLSTLRGLVCSA